jgi:hypothetical protein
MPVGSDISFDYAKQENGIRTLVNTVTDQMGRRRVNLKDIRAINSSDRAVGARLI